MVYWLNEKNQPNIHLHPKHVTIWPTVVSYKLYFTAFHIFSSNLLTFQQSARVLHYILL